jgi:CRISPR-associated protein Csb2
MSLTLEVEYLSGVSYAALGPDSGAPDWPPQPDRVFSALVASWAARGESSSEATALQWLETQRPPDVFASGHSPRLGGIHYVPPNDSQTGRSGNRDVLPWLRARKDRRFPATRPHVPLVRLQWPDASPDAAVFAALQCLARDTAYVGHSASLTRCRFLLDAKADYKGLAPSRSERRVYPGRLAELQRSYAEFANSGGKRGRPLPGAIVVAERDSQPQLPHAFSDQWLILEHVGGDMPDVRAAAIVSRTIRDALLSGYGKVGLGDTIPEVVSGHAADGSPTREPHMAVIPLTFVGYPHADGHLLGFAVVAPRDRTILQDRDFLRALRAIAPMDEQRGRRVLSVRPRRGTTGGAAFSVDLSPTFEAPPARQSLNPKGYCVSSTLFATVTPIVLDRHLRETGAAQDEEIAGQVARACERLGLPAPERVVPHKHSAIEGAPSARPSGGAPPWMRWRVPSSLSSRPLVHAVLKFAEPVQGPVILGAGRFVGLGLCLPLGGARHG